MDVVGEIACLWVFIKAVLCGLFWIMLPCYGDDEECSKIDARLNTSFIEFIGINKCNKNDMSSLLPKIYIIVGLVIVSYLTYEIVTFVKSRKRINLHNN